MTNASCAGSEKSIAVSLVREDQEENNFDHFLEDSTGGEPFSLFAGFLVFLLVTRGTNWNYKQLTIRI